MAHRPAVERSSDRPRPRPQERKRERDERAYGRLMTEAYEDSADEDREIAEQMFPLSGDAARD